MSEDVARLKAELDQYKRNQATLTDRLRERDLAEADRKAAANKPPEVNPLVKFNQGFVEKELANPKFCEQYRLQAWRENKIFGVDYPPEYHEGGWPEGLSAEIYVRRLNNLRDDGLGFKDEPEPAVE